MQPQANVVDHPSGQVEHTPVKLDTKTPASQAEEQQEAVVLPEDTPELRVLVNETLKTVKQLDDEIAERQAKKQASLESISSHRIPKKVFKMVRDYMKLDDKQQKQFDTAMQICRNAIGKPIQGEIPF